MIDHMNRLKAGAGLTAICSILWMLPSEGVQSATAPAQATDVADALIMLERDRQRALREHKAERNSLFTSDASADIDLWSIGIALVAAVLN